MALLAMSCTGTAGEDAGVDAGEEPEAFECPGAPAVDGVCPPIAPALPELPPCLEGDDPTGCAALPVFASWTCPTGWLTVPAFVDEDGAEDVPEGMVQHTICAPPPLAASCPLGEKPSPSTGLCTPVGALCPVDEWPSDLPASGVRYVRAGEVGGDGSIDAPFGTIADALGAAAAGEIIALAKGDYPEVVVVNAAVALRGACARDTRIVAPSASDTVPLVEIRGPGGATLADVTVTGARPGVQLTTNATAADLRGVVIHDVVRYGISFEPTGAGGTVTDALIHDVEAIADGSRGRGVVLGGAVEVTLGDLVIERARQTGILVFDNEDGTGPTLTLHDFIVRETRPDLATGEYGVGLYLLGPIVGTIARGIVDDNRAAGLLASAVSPSGGPTLTLEDLAVRRTAFDESFSTGSGLHIGGGSTVEASRVVLDETSLYGVWLFGSAEFGTASLTLRDAAITRGNAAPLLDTPTFSGGLTGGTRLKLLLERVIVANGRGAGIAIGFEDEGVLENDVTLRDVAVTGARWYPWSDPGGFLPLASGFAQAMALVGGHVTVERLLVEDGDGLGLRLGEGTATTTTTVTAVDVTVRGIHAIPASGAFDGSPLSFSGPLDASAERVVVRDAHRIGVRVSTATDGTAFSDVRLKDLLVDGIRQGTVDELPVLGYGIAVRGDVTLALEGAMVRDVDQVAIALVGRTALAPTAPVPTVTMSDVVVFDVQLDQDGIKGVGLWAVGVDVTAERLHLARTHSSAIALDADLEGAPTVVVVSDLTVDRVDGNVFWDAGSGVFVKGLVELTLTRAAIQDTVRAAFLVLARGFTPIVTASDLTVRRTTSTGCDDAFLCEPPFGGHGINVRGPATLELTRFDARENVLAGLQLFGDEVSVTATDGMLTGNEFGLTIQAPDVDRRRDFVRVRAVENRSADLSTEALDVPDDLDVGELVLDALD